MAMTVTNETTQDYWFGPLHLAAGVGTTLSVDDTSDTSLYLNSDAVADSINKLYLSGKITVSGAATPFPRPTGVPQLLHGDGSPEGLVFAPQGSLYMRRDNTGAPTSLYTKTTGVTIDTGWQAISGESTTGWVTFATTLTYSSADGHTFVCSTSEDLTGTIPLGAKIQLMHSSTTKYFIVTAIDASTISLYGGTDYALASGTISSSSYSLTKAPLGFPLSPLKWSEELSDTSDRSQSTPSAGTWYNPGSLSLAVPIGAWWLEYECSAQKVSSSDHNTGVVTTLSTASNSESDRAFTARTFSDFVSNANWAVVGAHYRGKFVVLTSKTTYYLNETNVGNASSIGLMGSSHSPSIIRAISAYL